MVLVCGDVKSGCQVVDLTPVPWILFLRNKLHNFISGKRQQVMQTSSNATRTGISKSTYLPNIGPAQSIRYAQRYEHMTKIANYNEMSEGQIWKQYEKLRMCLKELNEEVLHHMEKKAHTNLYAKEAPPTPSVQATLQVLEEEKRTNEARLQIFVNEAGLLEQRVQHLTNKTQYLQEITDQIEIAQSKIKEIVIENKDLKRKQKLTSKDLVAGASFLEKLVVEEQALHYAKLKHQKYQRIHKEALAKIAEFNQKTAEYQDVLVNRVHQYKQQEDYVTEEVNLEKFEQLQAQKANIVKYESIYKRSYLMKLKQLDTLVQSTSKHDQVIQEVEGNLMAMRTEIEQISALVNSNKTSRRSSMSMVQPLPSNNGSRSGRKSIIADNSLLVSENETKLKSANDKNRQAPLKF